MSTDVESLQDRLAELRGQKGALEAEWTRERLERAVTDWLAVARAHTAGASRLVVGGTAVGDDLYRVLAERALADEGLHGRLVSSLQARGFGLLSDKQRDSRLRKVTETIAAAEAELLARRKQEALDAVEAEFGGVAS
jgi:hypothetical protein